jgi:hypothetical protein
LVRDVRLGDCGGVTSLPRLWARAIWTFPAHFRARREKVGKHTGKREITDLDNLGAAKTCLEVEGSLFEHLDKGVVVVIGIHRPRERDCGVEVKTENALNPHPIICLVLWPLQHAHGHAKLCVGDQ